MDLNKSGSRAGGGGGNWDSGWKSSTGGNFGSTSGTIGGYSLTGVYIVQPQVQLKSYSLAGVYILHVDHSLIPPNLRLFLSPGLKRCRWTQKGAI